MANSSADHDWLSDWRLLYAQALAHGVDDTRRSAADERLEPPVWLLAQAERRLVIVAVAVPAIADARGPDADPTDPLALAGRRALAGAIRLAHRALEVHARDVGYDPARWLGDVPAEASAIADQSASPTPWELVREVDLIAEDLADAIVGLQVDRMGVPGLIVSALGMLLALYRRATPDGDA
jgi:hypothetical protein